MHMQQCMKYIQICPYNAERTHLYKIYKRLWKKLTDDKSNIKQIRMK